MRIATFDRDVDFSPSFADCGSFRAADGLGLWTQGGRNRGDIGCIHYSLADGTTFNDIVWDTWALHNLAILHGTRSMPVTDKEWLNAGPGNLD